MELGAIGVLLLACSSEFTSGGPRGQGGTSTTTSNSGAGGVVGGGGAGAAAGSGATGGGGAGAMGAAGGAAGSGGNATQPCTWSPAGDICPSGSYCNPTGLDCLAGFCAPINEHETNEQAPVCGCDGVIYWNVSVAAARGMPVRSSGECTSAQQAFCGGLANLPCPNPGEQSCDYRTQEPTGCDDDVLGRCWALPVECPGTAVTMRPCDPNQDQCDTHCQAIRAQAIYYQDPTCPG
jgi:hypothetical protein